MEKLTAQAELRTKLIKFAICSRVFILILSAVSNTLIKDHIAYGVYRLPVPPNTMPFEGRNGILMKMLGGLARWDAQYFLHISLYGYSYENILAFFPMFPLLTRILHQSLEYMIGPTEDPISTLLLSAVTVNFACFVGAVVVLFDLSCIVLQDYKIAYISTLFFCINPASIFFTAPYSESFFSFSTFSGLFVLCCNRKQLSSFIFGLSLIARSNGIINYGFVAHRSLKKILVVLSNNTINFREIKYVIEHTYELLSSFVLFIAPFVLFQICVYYLFCLDTKWVLPFLTEFATGKDFVTAGVNKPVWCNFTVPLSYSYVQSHYWNVGFLRYYEFKQIPNFLLACPVIYLILSNSYRFIVENKQFSISLGLKKKTFCTFHGRQVQPEFFVFVVQALFLTLFCVFFVHVQVTTRLIASSSPVLYWFAAFGYEYVSSPYRRDGSLQSRLKKDIPVETRDNLNSLWRTVVLTEPPTNFHSKMLRWYFYSYFVIGTILFSNFYPWT